jgi:predicted Zn-dependent protease
MSMLSDNGGGGDRPGAAGQEAVVHVGRLSDGQSPLARPVEVRLSADGLVIRPVPFASEAEETWPYAALAAAVPLKPGASDVLLHQREEPARELYVTDPSFTRALLPRARHLTARVERWRFARAGLAVAAVAACIGIAVWALNVSPAKGVARLLPASLTEGMGRQMLESFANEHPRCEREEGKAALARMLERLTRGTPQAAAVRVSVLDWPLVNAFALPGGELILTRGLLLQARSPDEVAGVLAHEIGHALERHPETSLVRGVGLWAIGQFLFSGAGGTLGTVGLALVQFGYSRQAEREADAHAVQLLAAAGISRRPLIEFFRRNEPAAEGEARRGGKDAPRASGSPFDLFSTHPAGPERVAALTKGPSYPNTPALDATEWTRLRAICAPAR